MKSTKNFWIAMAICAAIAIFGLALALTDFTSDKPNKDPGGATTTTTTTATTVTTTTKAPETTTEAPETTTQAPETTTKAPETTTQAPETTTKAPETTTQAPETTTKAPETTGKKIVGYKYYSGAMRHKVLYEDGTYDMADCYNNSGSCVCGRKYK